MSAEKRPADDDLSSRMLVKRQNVTSSESALARLGASSSALVQTVGGGEPATCVARANGVQASRTSRLAAPVMELTGHSGEIFAAKFDATGDLIASGSMDRSICTYAHGRPG